MVHRHLEAIAAIESTWSIFWKICLLGHGCDILYS